MLALTRTLGMRFLTRPFSTECVMNQRIFFFAEGNADANYLILVMPRVSQLYSRTFPTPEISLFHFTFCIVSSTSAQELKRRQPRGWLESSNKCNLLLRYISYLPGFWEKTSGEPLLEFELTYSPKETLVDVQRCFLKFKNGRRW